MPVTDEQQAGRDPLHDESVAIAARLEAAAVDVDAKRDALKLALRLRDELVVQAVELGMAQRQAGRHARVNQSRVLQILASH